MMMIIIISVHFDVTLKGEVIRLQIFQFFDRELKGPSFQSLDELLVLDFSARLGLLLPDGLPL